MHMAPVIPMAGSMKDRSIALGTLVACVGALLAPAAIADPRAILTQRGCLVCHDFDRRKVGPAYKDVASRYHGQPDAVEKLAAKVYGAKMGHPKTSVTLREAREAVAYILSRGKDGR